MRKDSLQFSDFDVENIAFQLLTTPRADRNPNYVLASEIVDLLAPWAKTMGQRYPIQNKVSHILRVLYEDGRLDRRSDVVRTRGGKFDTRKYGYFIKNGVRSKRTREQALADLAEVRKQCGTNAAGRIGRTLLEDVISLLEEQK